MRRRALLVLLLHLLCPAAMLAQQSARTGLALRPGTFRVRGTEVAVELGEFMVPANRKSPSKSAPLTLRFVRFPTTAEVPAPPIVFLAGGPGDAATRALGGMPLDYLAELRAIADVIAFDQRGTGSSEPPNPVCPPGPMLPRDRPGDPDSLAAGLRRLVESCLEDAPRRGIDVLGLTTEESADDVEALRRALGAPSFQLLAGSYGTHLALSVARRHPASVAAMVLAGVEGPDHTFKLPSQVDTVLARIAAARRPTLLREVRTLRGRLAAEPARFIFPGGRTIVLGEWDLQRWIAESLGTEREITAMLDALPSLLDGRFGPLAEWSLSQRVPRPIHLMNLAMDCASYASPERIRRIRMEGSSALLGNAMNFPKMELCEVPGLPRLGDDFRAPVQSRIPALLVAGTFDGRTPVANALEVAETLPNAELLVLDGASHDLFGHPEVMRGALRLFRRSR
jgi:pimeloyl-ACP methyl ester carboxylesterase